MIMLFLSIAFIAAAIIIPGYLVLRSIGITPMVSLSLSSLVSSAVYIVCGVVLFRCGISARWWMMILAALAIALIFVLLAKTLQRVKFKDLATSIDFGSKLQSGPYVLVLAACLAVGGVVFIGSLDGPDSFCQGFDVAHHLSQVMAMSQQGNWSTLDVNLTGSGSGGFYPSLLHIYAALVLNCFGGSASLALNAVIFVLIAFVFPSGICLLASILFPGSKFAYACCGALCLTFPGFPWILLRFCPLLANVAGFAFLPMALFLFVSIFRANSSLFERLISVALTVVALIVITIAHPNTFFSAAVFLFPYCVKLVYDATARLPFAGARKSLVRVLIAAAFVLACAFIWKAIHDLSYFQGIVSFEYKASLSLADAVLGIALMKMRWFTVHLPLAILVAIGLLRVLATKGYRWLAVSYCLAAIQLIACECLAPCALKSLLCGFWYNHDFRLMASFCVTAVPFAGLGVDYFVRFFSSVRKKGIATSLKLALFLNDSSTHDCEDASESALTSPRSSRKPKSFLGVPLTAIATIGALMVAICFPGFINLKGEFFTLPMGQAFAKLYALNDWEGDRTFYHSDEREFVEEAMGLIPEGAVVLNVPYDGSSYAYGVDGINVYYKTNFSYMVDADAEEILKSKLADVANDEEVAEIAQDLGIQYVMQLDHGLSEDSSIMVKEFDPEDWRGIDRIDGQTPGFETILERDDMRLDRIVVFDGK